MASQREHQADADSARARSGASRRAATQAAIIRATDELMAQARDEGSSAMFLNVKQIARRAGVAPSSIYNHFPGGVGSIALHLVDEARATGREPHPEAESLARLEQAKVMLGTDREARLVAELALLYQSEDAERARALLREADESRMSPATRFLARVTVAETIEEELPKVRAEMLAITKSAADLARAHGASHVQRQIIRDHHVNALLAPIRGKVSYARVSEAMTALHESVAFIRRHQISLSRDGWRLDALRRDFLLHALALRETDDRVELALFFEAHLAALVDEVVQPSGHSGGPSDHSACWDLMDILIAVESLDLIDNVTSDELQSRLLGWLPDDLPTSEKSDLRGLKVAWEVLRGRRSSWEELDLDDIAALSSSAGISAPLAVIRLGVAVPLDVEEDVLIFLGKRLPRELGGWVRSSYFDFDVISYEIAGVRRRLASYAEKARRASPGTTEVSIQALEALETAVRESLFSGRPFEPDMRERIRRLAGSTG